MCTVSIKVNDDLLHKALGSMYSEVDMAEWMQQQIEAILIKMALSKKQTKALLSTQGEELQIPDVVLSLLGAGEPLADDDLNGRNAYYQYLEGKHQ